MKEFRHYRGARGSLGGDCSRWKWGDGSGETSLEAVAPGGKTDDKGQGRAVGSGGIANYNNNNMVFLPHHHMKPPRQMPSQTLSPGPPSVLPHPPTPPPCSALEIRHWQASTPGEYVHSDARRMYPENRHLRGASPTPKIPTPPVSMHAH